MSKKTPSPRHVDRSGEPYLEEMDCCGRNVGILQFELPEFRSAFRDAQNGTLYKIVLHRLDEYLRGISKYEENREARVHAAKFRAQLYEELSVYNLSLEDE